MKAFFETVFVKINYSSGGGAAGEALALLVRRRCTACRTEIGICKIIFVIVNLIDNLCCDKIMNNGVWLLKVQILF